MSSHDLYARDSEEFFFPYRDASAVNSATDILPEFQTRVSELSSVTFHSLVGRGNGSDSRYSGSAPCLQLGNLCLYPSGLNGAHPLPVLQNEDPVFGGTGIIKTGESDLNWGGCREDFFSRGCYGHEEPNYYYKMQRNGSVNESRYFSNVYAFSDGWMDSPADGFEGLFSGQIRRACSTGDLQVHRISHRLMHVTPNSPERCIAKSFLFLLQSLRGRPPSTRASWSQWAGETSLDIGELPNAKAVRCSAEERKEKILKYRAKRTHRNFNKTIKYECRKTLADNRPRVRGRFARNDEVGVPGDAACHAHNGGDDNFWVGFGLHGSVGVEILRGW